MRASLSRTSARLSAAGWSPCDRRAGALARAFAHTSVPGDRALLERASEASPLVFWAMRYAAAVVAIDEGELTRVEELLADAPSWPQESTFRAFHDEIADRAGLPRPASA